MTVFIGPNNTGKTAIRDAIRIALTRKCVSVERITEYDIPDDFDQRKAITLEATSSSEFRDKLWRHN